MRKYNVDSKSDSQNCRQSEREKIETSEPLLLLRNKKSWLTVTVESFLILAQRVFVSFRDHNEKLTEWIDSLIMNMMNMRIWVNAYCPNELRRWTVVFCICLLSQQQIDFASGKWIIVIWNAWLEVARFILMMIASNGWSQWISTVWFRNSRRGSF